MTLEDRARLIADRRNLTPGSVRHRDVAQFALCMLQEVAAEAQESMATTIFHALLREEKK
jgi:hypothetical protein